MRWGSGNDAGGLPRWGVEAPPQPGKVHWAVDGAAEGSGDKQIGGTSRISPQKEKPVLLPQSTAPTSGEIRRGCWGMLGVGACRSPAWPRVTYSGVALARGVKHHPRGHTPGQKRRRVEAPGVLLLLPWHSPLSLFCPAQCPGLALPALPKRSLAILPAGPCLAWWLCLPPVTALSPVCLGGIPTTWHSGFSSPCDCSW